jgi:hypothetical protein
VRKLIAIGVGAVGAAALFGQGTAAAAPDVSGMTYEKAVQVLSQSGLSPVVATRLGDRTDDASCIVDRVQDANFTGGTGATTSGVVFVYLNCYGSAASPDSPGYSAQNPMLKTVEENAG